MMKLVCLAVALLGVASANIVPHQTRSLVSSIDKIKAVIPYQQIIEISLGCAGDAKLEKLIELLKSDITQQAVDVFVANEDVVEFVFWLDAHGVDAIDLLNKLFSLLGLRPIGVFNAKGDCGGWEGLHSKIMAVLDLDKIGAVIVKQWAEDAEFGEMMNILKGSQSTLQDLIQPNAVRHFLDELKANGVDTIAIRDVIRKLFGW